jgi:hypothetical protein
MNRAIADGKEHGFVKILKTNAFEMRLAMKIDAAQFRVRRGETVDLARRSTTLAALRG